MPTDIFDEVADKPVDVFDQVGAHSKGDIFDEVGGRSDFSDLQDQLDQPARTGEERAARDYARAKASGLTTGNVPSEYPNLLDEGMKFVGKGTAQAWNIIPSAIYGAGRMTGSPKLAGLGQDLMAEQGKPVPGVSLISDSVKNAVKAAITPKDITGVPVTGDHPAAEGVSQSIKQAVDSLGTPEGIATLPLLEAKAARAIMAGDSLLKTPEQIRQTVAVIQDPNATAEQKWKAIGDSGVSLGMTAGLGLSLRGGHGEAPVVDKPVEVAEPAAQPIEQPLPVVPSNAPTEIPLNPGGAPSDLPPEKLAISQQNNSPEAFKAVQEQADAAKVGQSTNADVVPEPEMVGMGGAVPAEFEQPETFVSNMFAAIDADRAKMGKPPMPETQTRSWDQDNTTALNRMQRDPEWIPDLIKEVTDKPRPLLSWENAGMVWQRAKWRGEANNALARVSQAFDDGRTDDLAAARLDVARFEDKLDALDKAVGRNGTGSEAGRSLNAQKMAAGDDFSLIEMRLEKRALANDGAPLTPKQEAEVEHHFKEIQEKQKALEEHVAKQRDRISELEASKAIDQMVNESARGIHPKVLEYAEKFVKGLETAAEEASKRILDRLSRTNAGLDPTLLADLAIVGSAKLARGTLELSKWTTELVAKFGDKIAPHLDEIKKASEAYLDQQLSRQPKPVKDRVKKSLDAAQRQAALKEAIGSRIKEGKPDTIGNLVQTLARTFVEQGIRNRDKLVDAVWGVLKESDPLMTRDEAMDAISGYGKFKQLSGDQISVELRDIKGQIQQVAKLRDIQAKKPLQKTGVERRSQSDEERRLIQQVNEAKRRHGVVVTDPARQLKSSLDAIKTNLRNRIADLEYQIAQGKKTVKSKTATPLDAEATALKAEKQKLQEQFDAIFGKSELTDAQRVALAKNALEKSIAEYERRIKEGDLSTKKSASKTPNTPELKVLRAQRDALKSQFEDLRDAANPKRTPEQIANQSLRTRLTNRIAELEAKTAAGDFSTKPRRALVLEPETLKAQADFERVKKAFEQSKEKDRLARRSIPRKIADIALRIRREFVLSMPSSILKLASYSAQEMTLGPLKELVGLGLSKLPFIDKVAAKSSSEVGFNVGDIVEDYTQAFTQGIKDAKDTLTKGGSDLKVKYDPAFKSEPEFRAFFGTLHQMEKSPLLRLAFTRSFRRRMEFNAKIGVDITDGSVMQRIGVEAYQDALRAALINRNEVVNKVNRFVNSLEEKNKATGRMSLLGSAAKLAFNAETPVQHVPVNYIARTAEYIFGSLTGSVKTAMAFKRGIETLQPEEANQIMRHLKSGAVGSAAIAIGFFAPQIFGGLWTPNRDNKQPLKPGEIQLGGLTVPRSATHDQLLNAAQFGATVRKVAESKLRKKDPDAMGLGAGAMGALFGLVDEAPYMQEIEAYGKLKDPATRGKFAGEKLKGYLVPGGISQIAEWMDKNDSGKTINRSPRNIWEHVEAGIPRLRKEVPVNAKKPVKD